MSSPVEIMNRALSECGSANFIGSLQDTSEEAKVLKLHYWKCVQECMEDFPYSFGDGTQQLAVLMSPTVNVYDPNNIGAMPTPEYSWAYQYPPECLHLRRLFAVTGQGQESNLFDAAWDPGWPWGMDSTQSRLPYKVAQNPNQKGTLWVLCNWAGVWAEFLFAKVPENLFSGRFERAVVCLLAKRIAPKMVGDPQEREGVINRLEAEHQQIVVQAKINNANEQQDPALPDSELIRTRVGVSLPALGGPYPWTSFPTGIPIA